MKKRKLFAPHRLVINSNADTVQEAFKFAQFVISNELNHVTDRFEILLASLQEEELYEC